MNLFQKERPKIKKIKKFKRIIFIKKIDKYQTNRKIQRDLTRMKTITEEKLYCTTPGKNNGLGNGF